jgi:ElaB/YqjD/DUF883 family membrane-anchored ribosome-binding protein
MTTRSQRSEENRSSEHEDWKSTAQEQATRILQQARSMGRKTIPYLRQNTWMSMGIAAGVGFLASTLLMRRR